MSSSDLNEQKKLIKSFSNTIATALQEKIASLHSAHNEEAKKLESLLKKFFLFEQEKSTLHNTIISLPSCNEKTALLKELENVYPKENPIDWLENNFQKIIDAMNQKTASLQKLLETRLFLKNSLESLQFPKNVTSVKEHLLQKIDALESSEKALCLQEEVAKFEDLLRKYSKINETITELLYPNIKKPVEDVLNMQFTTVQALEKALETLEIAQQKNALLSHISSLELFTEEQKSSIIENASLQTVEEIQTTADSLYQHLSLENIKNGLILELNTHADTISSYIQKAHSLTEPQKKESLSQLESIVPSLDENDTIETIQQKYKALEEPFNNLMENIHTKEVANQQLLYTNLEMINTYTLTIEINADAYKEELNQTWYITPTNDPFSFILHNKGKKEPITVTVEGFRIDQEQITDLNAILSTKGLSNDEFASLDILHRIKTKTTKK